MSRLYSLKELREQRGAPNRHALLKLIRSGRLRSFQMTPGGKHLVKGEWWDEYIEEVMERRKRRDAEGREWARRVADKVMSR